MPRAPKVPQGPNYLNRQYPGFLPAASGMVLKWVKLFSSPGTFSFPSVPNHPNHQLGKLCCCGTYRPLIPGDPPCLVTPHIWGPLIPGDPSWDPSYLGTPHTWRPIMPEDPSYLGTPHTWGPLIPGDPSYLGTPQPGDLSWDPSYLATPHT